MNKKLAKQLVGELREIARLWREAPEHGMFCDGICEAHGHLPLPKTSYSFFEDVLHQAQDFGIYMRASYDQPSNIPFAQDRAFMCLFLVEWLETEVLGKKV